MPKKIGRFTYEGRYVIMQVPDDWKITDPVPPPSPDDVWFDQLQAFEAALAGPWDRRPIQHRPWTAPPPEERRREPSPNRHAER